MAYYGSVFGGHMAAPGINAPLSNVENTFYWNNHYLNVFDKGSFVSSAVDAGNTVTTVLRPGLLLGKVYSTGLLKEWNPSGTDGSQYIWGVLDNPGLSMADSLGTARARFRGGLVIRGAVKPSRLLIPGQASFGISGNANEYLIRHQLQQRGFLLQDDPLVDSLLTGTRFFGMFNNIVAKTTAYTVKEYESGTLFTTRGAAADLTFTLPTTAKKGLYYGFYNVADYEMLVASGTADTMVSFNDAAADSVAFTTASEQIGGSFVVMGDGTSWLVFPFSFGLGLTAQTVTTAT